MNITEYRYHDGNDANESRECDKATIILFIGLSSIIITGAAIPLTIELGSEVTIITILIFFITTQFVHLSRYVESAISNNGQITSSL